jgi:hypothetical protein
MTEKTELFVIARAEALFASGLSTTAYTTKATVSDAIRYAIVRYGGVRACAGEVAAAYGDHPDTAAPRMRWAREVVALVYPRG